MKAGEAEVEVVEDLPKRGAGAEVEGEDKIVAEEEEGEREAVVEGEGVENVTSHLYQLVLHRREEEEET